MISIHIFRESVDNINDWVDKLMPVSHEENAENIVKVEKKKLDNIEIVKLFV